jgi:hypothetical protein
MALTATQIIQGPVTPGGTTLSLAGSDVGSATITKSNIKMFISGVLTGTGSAQNIAHGLGVVPTNVFTSFTGSTASQAVSEGTHTTTNIVVTVTSAATFKVLAIV